MMKVLHISSERSWRGGEQQIAYLIEESRSQGVDCSVFLRRGSAFHDWAEQQGVSNQTAAFSNTFDLRTALRLKKYVARQSIDLIHIHSGKGHDMYAVAYLLGLRCKAVLSRRVDFPVKSNPWARWKYNLNWIERIICVSNAIRKMTAPSLSQPAKAITVHSGIDLSRFEGVSDTAGLRTEYEIPETTPLIGNVSALAPHKDLITFVRTASDFFSKGGNAKFFIVGEGGERGKIESEIQLLGLEGEVILTGFRNDVPAVLKELDVFLITSETEGLGTTVLDSFASELPVVATRAGGIPESVINNETGLLCPVKDHEALSLALIQLIDDTLLQDRLVGNAKKHLMKFTKEETANQTLRIYEEVLSES